MAIGCDKSSALFVLHRLRDAGHVAFFAGGCVRDMLLSTEPKDYDIATDATPEQVEALFRRVLMVGAKFGVAMVIHHRQHIEVATFRTDASYTDGRRPDGVTFSSPREDALRRDFTINGMFYDPDEEKVIDYVDGQIDLKAGLIRTIGTPAERFGEDYLRLLRAVRFATRLSFTLDEATRKAVIQFAPQINTISGERIFDEIENMLAKPTALASLELLAKLDLAKEVLPAQLLEDQAWTAALKRVAMASEHDDSMLCFLALLGDLPVADTNRLLRRWGASNHFRDLLRLVREHRDSWATFLSWPTLAERKRLLARPGYSTLRALWEIRERCQTGRHATCDAIDGFVATLDPAQISPPPLLTGAMAMDRFDLVESPELGKLLRTLYTLQLEIEPADLDTLLTAASEQGLLP
ncbi:MAG: CCA tRNA nucleotidyltransferase [Phycisphaerales bacterium]|jgi:poly(A) polymerase|nr:CCA tRNA nucleotidyltransferase [Phycisphaerales bacterium]MBT7171000.1 CCA tRNA nucleotidyltransferase [Phycisphaerales bacterium]